MKTTLKLVLAIAIIAVCSNVSAQTQKMAHINLDELIVAMPEYDSAMVKMQKFKNDLTDVLDGMNTDRNKLYEEYTTKSKDWTEIVKKSKEEAINSLGARIQQFQERAVEEVENEQNKLFQPIIEKANKAIADVAKEQGVTYVISANSLLYKATGTLDLLQDVKKKMGITK